MANLNEYAYQDRCVDEIFAANGRTLVSLDMGLGKTIISLRYVLQAADALPALVVCPASVKFNWVYEALDKFGIHADVCESQRPPESGGLSMRSGITIINYDIATYWVDHIHSQRFRSLIIDECQYLQNPRAKRTKAIARIAADIPKILALSGTPITNRPSELYPILNILWPHLFPSFWSYAEQFCNPKRTPWGWDYKGAANLDRLHAILKSCGMVRYRKDEVLKDLPDKVRRIIPCEIEHREQYEEASTDFLGWLKKHKAGRVRSASRAEQLARLGYLIRLAAKLKMRGPANWANRFLEETNEKLIIFAIHKKALQLLRRRIHAEHVYIDGSTSPKLRQLAVEQFQKDPKTRVIIGQMQAAGVGTTLTAASEIGLFEIPWRPADALQAEKRADRIGQKSTVFANYLIAGGTIEEDLCRILQKKQEIISSVLDGGPAPDDLNIYDELLRILDERL